MKKIKIIVSSSPNSKYVNINFINRDGILRKGITYSFILRQTNYYHFNSDGEKYFFDVIKDVFTRGREKLLSELKEKDTINIVTVDGKENTYSKIAKSVLKEILSKEGFEIN